MSARSHHAPDREPWDEWIGKVRESEGDALADMIERYVKHGPTTLPKCANCGDEYEGEGFSSQAKFCSKPCHHAFYYARRCTSDAVRSGSVPLSVWRNR